MTTVIVIHGIGGRLHNYPETFEIIKKAIQDRRQGVIVQPCLWGDDHGAKYRVGQNISVSTPRYDETIEEENLDEYLLWEQLYKDPYYEIRFLSQKQPQVRRSIRSGDQLTPSQQLDASLKRLLESYTTRKDLNHLTLLSGIKEDIFKQTYQEIIELDFYQQLKNNASESLNDSYDVLSRLFVAKVIYLLKYSSASICYNAKQRNKLVDLCFQILTEKPERALGINWLKKQSLLGLQCIFVDSKRGSLTDNFSPLAGDILVYQANGKRIRQFIKDEIEKEEIEPPVVLLAHSLGGIACVDLLVEQDLPKVKLLITVGSQAPFLYEIGALQSLLPDPITDQLPLLPQHFFSEEKWLNIYDTKDILSYYAEGAFPGRVKDVPVNNKQPFPEAHLAYWSNENMWEEIVNRL